MKSAVILAANKTMTAAQLNQIGVYRQLRYTWTRNKDFPAPIRHGKYDQAAVVAWLRANGWNVEVV